jgi:sugar lactone lactonase YvrE
MKKFRTNKIRVAMAALSCICTLCPAQDISTFAGTGASGFSGDGGAATLAQFSGPGSIALDALGNLYVADYWNNRIRKISATGIITTFAGTGVAGSTGDGGLATAAQLNFPTAVAVDQLGNVYISDAFSNRVRKINTAGIINNFAGTGVSGYSGDGGAASSADLCPGGLTIDASGNVYISDGCTSRIRKVNTSGVISTIAGTGTFGYSGDGGPATSAQLYSPSGLTTDAIGNLYFADGMNNTVRKINTSGIISTIAGVGSGGYNGDGITATTAQLSSPSAVCLGPSGNLYIADASNNRIRMVNSLGIISTLAGTGVAGWSGDGGAASVAQLKSPTGIVSDNAGNFYVADQGNQRIRKISPTVPTPSICLVTADSLGNNNEIYWEKTLYPQADTFIVLRETSSNNYTPIGRVPKTAFSSYVDVNRSIGLFNGDPNFSFYKYKLQIKDTDGVVGPMSPYHQSIYIQDAQTGNFTWNYYFIEGIGNIQTASYILWRQNVLTGASTTVGATSANVANDAQYSNLSQNGNVKWYVSTSGFNCNPSQRSAVVSKSRTKSNNSNERQFPSGIDAYLFEPGFFTLYPNPAKSSVNIRLSLVTKELDYKLTDASGRIVAEQKLDPAGQEINTEGIPAGLYFVTIYSGRMFICSKKLILEH